MAVFSLVSFTAMSLVMRGARDGFGPVTAAFWRSALGFLFIVPAGFMAGRSLTPEVDSRKMLVVRSLAGATSLVCYYYAISHIDLGTANALCYIHPLITTPLSAIYLKEKPTKGVYASIVVAWLGLAILTGFRPSLGLGELMGFLGGVFAALALHALRLARVKGEGTIAILVYFLGLTTILTFPVAAWEMARQPEWQTHFFALTLIAVTATGGQTGLTVAYKHLPVSVAGPISFLTVPLSALGSWYFFHETLHPSTLLGGGILVAGLIGTSVFQKNGVGLTQLHKKSP